MFVVGKKFKSGEIHKNVSVGIGERIQVFLNWVLQAAKSSAIKRIYLLNRFQSGFIPMGELFFLYRMD
jgi:ABC-type ATPase involved in cell division